MNSNYSEQGTHLSYLKYLMIWISLIILVVFNIILNSFNFGLLGLFLSLLIVFIESILIIKSFMHFRFTDLIFKFYLLIGIISLVVVFLLVN